MVTLQEVIQVEATPEEAFAFVSDFANSQRWDPGVRVSRREDTGPVAVGSTFRLMVSFRKATLPMTYRITEFDPPRRVVLHGEGSTVLAVDEIVVEPVGRSEGPGPRARISYRADLRMRGPLAMVEPFLRPSFRAMGTRALAGLRSALDERSAAARG